MKTGIVNISGRQYLLCFSTRVLINLQEYTHTANDGDAITKILNDGNIKDIFWLTHQMILAGDKYAKMNDIKNPDPISYDDLIDFVGVDEYSSLFNAVTGAVADGATPDIEIVDESKNSAASQEI